MELSGSICKTESNCTQTMVEATKRDENDDSHWAIRRGRWCSTVRVARLCYYSPY